MLATGTQRDKYIDDLMRTDALLEYAVQHGMTEEAEQRAVRLYRQAAFLGSGMARGALQRLGRGIDM